MRYIETCNLPTQWGNFKLHAFEDASNDKSHLAIAYGQWRLEDSVLVRVHSECLTGDALFSQRCDCGPQLALALEKIAEEGAGAVLYLRQEGRGIGLLNKVRAYHYQDQGADTVEANERLGFGADLRDYSMCKPMLEHLGIRKLRLLTNNPRKVQALQALGLEIDERLIHKAGENPHNERYLETKAGKLGHLFE